MDAVDRRIVDRLQSGIEITARPFAALATAIGIEEHDLLARLARLLDDGTLSRFGPMYDVEAMGGAYSLAAMRVPAQDYERVAEAVNRHPEVAHNYAREHAFNMWFVVAAESKPRVAELLSRIESETGCRCFEMPKQDEYYVGLKLDA